MTSDPQASDVSELRQAEAPPAGGDLATRLADWLIEQALGEDALEAVFEGCCRRLYALGIPLMRGHIGFRTLHPLYNAVTMTWQPDGGLDVQRFTPEADARADWRASPLHYMIEHNVPVLRRRLVGDGARFDFSVLRGFREAGGTDYLAFLVVFDPARRTGMIGSWLADAPDGFSEADLTVLQRVQRYLALACKTKMERQIAHNVVDAYLGPQAGREVLEGRIRRGEGRLVEAALWYSDLRSSTPLAERLPVEGFLAHLNTYFEATAGAVLAAGGDIIMLIGDAVLAMFPADGDAQAACRRAWAAAEDALARLETANRDRPEAERMRCGIGLHYGTVVFGNLGVPERLEFSVVGADVNRVTRLEDLTKHLGRPVLASAAFARHVDIDWSDLGRHELRGVADAQPVFAPADPDASQA